MKTTKILYWVSTALVSGMMLFAAFSYFTSPMAKTGFQHLGFPDYFRVELGVAKVLGAIALLLPWLPTKIKEFAYSGFIIVFVSAFIAHLSTGDSVQMAFGPLMALVFLGISYFYFNKTNVK